MDIDKLPVIGKMHRSVSALIVNFILLAVICIILGFVIPFFPRVLDIIVGAALIVGGLIFLSIAYHIYQYKKKYLKVLNKMKIE